MPERPSPRQAAVPWYIGTDFSDAPPGHRYLLYLPFWKSDWRAMSEGKDETLQKVGPLPDHAQAIMQGLATRQRELGKALGTEVIDAASTSPFATGLGWEHPNENGFAFLQPYGLPYLAGSGVKGVARRAAEELALVSKKDPADGEEGSQWTLLDIWWLFGFEGAAGSIWNGNWAPSYEQQKETLLERPDLPEFLERIGITAREGSLAERLGRLGSSSKRKDLAFTGALRFFDVIPELTGKALGVDIMNPHYSEYYQGKSTPHDAGSPIPIFFLVVPPGSTFTFVVDCPRERMLPRGVRETWRALIRAAMDHAFDWLGFGAKTAVGYGAMERRDEKVEKLKEHEQESGHQKTPWVDEKIKELSSKPGINPDDVLRGKALADAVRGIEEAAFRAEVLQDIERRWKQKGSWENPRGKAAKEAKKIYDELMKEAPSGQNDPKAPGQEEEGAGD